MSKRSFFTLTKCFHPTTTIRKIEVNFFSNGARTTIRQEDDFFAIFDLPQRYQLDQSLLKSKYRNLMKELHPDKQKSGEETHEAPLVTHAYLTLKKPHTRATYLMQLLGNEINEETTSSSQLLPPSFLMEMLEQREALEESNEEELRTLLQETVGRIDTIGHDLQTALDEKDDTKARQCAAMLQYYHRMEEAIVSKMDTVD